MYECIRERLLLTYLLPRSTILCIHYNFAYISSTYLYQSGGKANILYIYIISFYDIQATIGYDLLLLNCCCCCRWFSWSQRNVLTIFYKRNIKWYFTFLYELQTVIRHSYAKFTMHHMLFAWTTQGSSNKSFCSNNNNKNIVYLDYMYEYM